MSKLLVLPIIAASFAGLHAQQVNQNPSRIFGHKSSTLTSMAPNLVEGRELFNPTAVAVDNSASPPILYVADSGNNRVLVWRNASGFVKGDPADAVLGQRDFTSTTPQGPGTGLTTGLNFPSGLAVDSQGNLYVADSGNNRILRYQRPLAQTDEIKFPDMVIGQPNFNSNTTPAASATTLALRRGGTPFHIGMVFDVNGNLWVSDTGNNRILRFPLAALRPGAQAAADAVLGQFSLTTSSANDGRSPLNLIAMTQPTGIRFDPAGRLYACDALGRILVYPPGATTGAAAVRVMGLFVAPSGATPPPVNESTLGLVRAGRVEAPEDIFFIGNTPFALDTAANRIVRYDPFESWPAVTPTVVSPPGRQFIGQRDALSFNPNGGSFEPSESSFNRPVSAAVTPTDVFIVDQSNHRVLGFAIQGGTISLANRLFGQSEFYQSAPNFVEGKELYLWAGWSPGVPGQSSDGAGVAIDSRSNPPRLYIADTYNHRILGFRDARSVRPGDRADIVIGQRNLLRALVNDPTDRADQITQQGLFLPAGLAVDSFGNLYVADSGNGRVLRFPRPFEQTAGQINPDLVLGQSGPTTKITDASARNMARPYGLAFTSDGSLLASDLAHNRVLLFRRPAGGDFTTGQAAEKVIGQPDFFSTGRGNSPNRMNTPHSIAVDAQDRLYVCDTANGRIQIYDTVGSLPPDPSTVLALTGLSNPHGIAMNPTTGEFWVTNTTAGALRRYPAFQRIVFNPAPAANVPLASGNAPLALAQDSFGNLVVAESVNRVSFYFSGLLLSNAANNTSRFAPGAYTVVKPGENASFGDTTLIFDQIPNPIPMPTTLGDLQVLVNNVPSPLHFVSPQQINFIVPQATPASGVAEVTVLRPSSGQVLGSGSMQMSAVAPGFFTSTGDGRGQIAAINFADSTINSPVNPVSAGGFISLFGSGLGAVPGAPPDGVPVTAATPSADALVVQLQGEILPAENVIYSGLAPSLISVWQLTIKVPETVRPGPQVPLAATVNSIPTGTGTQTTIAVKP
jgi:uncharacterized protein (TIGR03437 family)